MTYAFVHDLPVSWDAYEQIAAEFDGPAPRGLVIHVAGPTDEGVRMIDVWEAEADFRVFERERLGPAVHRHLDRRLADQTFRDVSVNHLIEGNRRAATRTPAPTTPERERHP